MKLFFSKILAGAAIGAGAIIPGLSGGILAVSMGLYQPMIEAIVGFFKAPKKNFKFLLPLGLGGAVGFVLFLFLIDGLFANYQTEIICLFTGLILGSIPSFLKDANEGKPFKKTSLIYLAAGFTFSFVLFLLGFLTDNNIMGSASGREVTPLLAVISGGIIIFGTVLPGISTSFILINMGLYEGFLDIFTDLFGNHGHNLLLAGCTVLGILIVAVPMLLLVKKVMNRFHRQSYYTLLGILAGTVVGCVIQEIQRNIAGTSIVKVIFYIALFAFGLIMSYFMDKGMKKLEAQEAADRCLASDNPDAVKGE